MSFENFLFLLFFYSIISVVDDKFNSDDFLLFVFILELGFESDLLDDVLEIDCWDLELVKMDLLMMFMLLNYLVFRMILDVYFEFELY